MNTINPKVLNMTAHPICIYADEQIEDLKARKLHLIDEACTPEKVYEASGLLATADRREYDGGIFDFTFEYSNVSELPDGYDYYIVSKMYLDACVALGRDTSKLRTIYGSITDKATEKVVLGCRRLCKP